MRLSRLAFSKNLEMAGAEKLDFLTRKGYKKPAVPKASAIVGSQLFAVLDPPGPGKVY